MKFLGVFLSVLLVQFIDVSYAGENGIELSLIIDKLKWIADPNIAVDWDNIGLMVEPTKKPHTVNKILIVNDLTEPVLDDAIKKGVQLIITYHPVITKPIPITRLTQATWKQRALIKCIEHGIAVYTSHTSWDSFDGGINDWILKFFNVSNVEAVKPVKEMSQLTGFDLNIRVDLSESVENSTVFRKLLRNKEIKFMGEMDLFKGYTSTQSGLVEAEFITTQQGFMDIVDCIRKFQPNALKTLRSTQLEKPWMKHVGLGRHATLNEPQTLGSIVEQLKKLFKMDHMRFSLANGKSMSDSLVSSIIVSAGSAAETWWKFSKSADLLICGELAHHELLQSAHDGMSVILTEHSNSERFFFENFKDKFAQMLSQIDKDAHVDIMLSEWDHDPIIFV